MLSTSFLDKLLHILAYAPSHISDDTYAHNSQRHTTIRNPKYLTDIDHFIAAMYCLQYMMMMAVLLGVICRT